MTQCVLYEAVEIHHVSQSSNIKSGPGRTTGRNTGQKKGQNKSPQKNTAFFCNSLDENNQYPKYKAVLGDASPPCGGDRDKCDQAKVRIKYEVWGVA